MEIWGKSLKLGLFRAKTGHLWPKYAEFTPFSAISGPFQANTGGFKQIQGQCKHVYVVLMLGHPLGWWYISWISGPLSFGDFYFVYFVLGSR
jgi:hypothetical protein